MSRSLLLGAALAVVAVCAQAQDLGARVEAALVARGLGKDALGLVGNIIAHEFPTPRATPALVMHLLHEPLRAADARTIFERSVPSDIVALTDLSPRSAGIGFDAALERYIGELAAAQAELMGAVAPFDEVNFVRALANGMPAGDFVAIEQAVDAPRLAQARALFLEATARFVRELRSPNMRLPAPQRFNSAIGLVIIGSPGPDRHPAGAALIIDPGGDDVYERAPASGGAISVIIDLGGNDRYVGTDVAARALSAIIDVGGNDSYVSDGPGLGAAVGGVSVLVDLDGDDEYQAHILAQGAAIFGVGALIDAGGNDRYRTTAFGQGYAGSGGLGLLWDRRGNDDYRAGALQDRYRREGGLSFAQGAAAAARGELAGGIGILRDDAGDDRYQLEMFGQGMGYYYSLGMLWDGAGNDEYSAIRYAQGAGVHQAVGVLRDDSGNDHYELSAGMGQGVGYDASVGVLFDGAGDDRYRASYMAQASGYANGFGLLADLTGANAWEMGDDAAAWGHARWFRALPTIGVLLYEPGSATFARNGKPSAPAPPRVEQEREAQVDCAAADTQVRRLLDEPRIAIEQQGELLPCVLALATPEQAARYWSAFDAALQAPGTPALGEIAVALRAHPGPAELMQRLQAALREHPRCRAHALWMAGWGTVEDARAALGAACWRLQAAAQDRLKALGAAPSAASSTAQFLRPH